MNSLERKRLRYLRRKEIREKKIIERSNKYASLDKAFCFHKVMYNEILDPIYIPHLIYDNGASQKNKEFIFALYRLKDIIVNMD